MPEIDFNVRANLAARYYFAFSKLNFESADEWLKQLYLYLEDDHLGFPEMLTLIHPNWYPSIKLPDPRGSRSFPTADKYAECRSLEIYNYKCPFTKSTIQIDHQFPYSKGGVTNYANAMYLCSEHNLAKSTDIHFIDWVGMDKSWVIELMNKFIHQISRLVSDETPLLREVNRKLDS